MFLTLRPGVSFLTGHLKCRIAVGGRGRNVRDAFTLILQHEKVKPDMTYLPFYDETYMRKTSST